MERYKVVFDVTASLNIHYIETDRLEEIVIVSKLDNIYDLKQKLVSEIKELLIKEGKVGLFFQICPFLINVNIISINKVSGGGK